MGIDARPRAGRREEALHRIAPVLAYRGRASHNAALILPFTGSGTNEEAHRRVGRKKGR